MTKGDLSNRHCTRGVQRNKNFMRHYHDCTLRLFSNGRADDYLSELFLNAAKNGDYERVQNFLARTSRNTSVNVDAKDREGGYTAVMLAALNEHAKVVSLLLNYGADITLCNNKGQSVLDFAPDSMRPLLLGSVARQGYSSRHLLQAAWQGNSQLVKKLLSSKSKSAVLDVNCTNADGLTPLLLVTRDLNLFEKIEKAVLENGYHPAEVVKELLHHNADCGAKDSEGKRPLHFAAHNKGSHAKDVIEVLIEKAASDIDVPDRFSNSPLHWATKEDNQPILLALIKGGANVNARGHIGKTPLHIAASHGYEKASGTLLDHGADVTITDDYGLSAVDVAMGRRVQVVLRDAWSEQTKNNKSKRIFSAPVQSPDHQEETQQKHELGQTALAQQVVEDSTITRISTAPLRGTEKKLKKRLSQSSTEDVSVLDERKSILPSKKMSDVRMPRILSATKTDSSPGSRSTSVVAVHEQSGKQELAPGTRDAQTSSATLPSLSVLNIELTYVRNLRGGKQESRNKNRPTRLPLPPHYRIHHRLSSPVLTYKRKVSPPGTPDRDSRLRSSSTSQVPSSRVALPSRVPPLGVNRVLTPELRSITSPEIMQESLSVAPEVVDLDLLRENGIHNGVASSMLSSEVRQVSPPPPSPRGSSRASNTSQDDVVLEPNQTQTGEGIDMTRTFTSIPRSTFWIPTDDSSTNMNKESSEKKSEQSPSNGTKFFIDLTNLESLASGNCSLCGDSLPEGKPAGRRDSTESSSNKELCKSCQPRRRSSEDVFWIPFTDKRKASALKAQHGNDSTQRDDGKKSNDKNSKQCTQHQITDNQTENQAQREATPAVDSSNKAVVLTNTSSELGVSSSPKLRSFPSDMTGFDVSCVCDNITGVCSCTIVKKDLFPSSPAAKYTDVVETFGETSSVAESTLVTSQENISAALTRAASPAVSKSKTKKETEITLRSFSETDVYNPTAHEDTEVNSNFSNEQSSSIGKENHTGSSIGSNIDSSKVLQGAQLSSTQEAQPNEAHKETSDSAPDLSPPKEAWTTPRLEEPGSSSVRIINPFPSPEPPPANKSGAVHPPIGPAGDARIGNKKVTSGKKGKKGGPKRSGDSKNSKPRTKSKSQEHKGGKKKGKGKKKDDMKMITVQQREVEEELGLRTISQGGFEMPEDVPVPPTLSMDYLSTFRPVNARMLKGKHNVLSPIPESPRSKANTPRVSEVPESVTESNTGSSERNAAGHLEIGATGEGDGENCEGEEMNGEFDVVDGRVISKLKMIGMCVPRLKFGKSNTDSWSDEESSEFPLVHPQGGNEEKQQYAPVETGTVSENEDRRVKQVIHDEADDVMEEMVRRKLSLLEENEVSGTVSEQSADSQSHTTTEDSLTNVTSHASSSLSVLSDQEYSRDLVPEIPSESDFVITGEETERRSIGSRTSSELSSCSEQYSDTDSSYNSGESDSPRPLSPASSLNSSDTYFSSPRDSSHANTPTPATPDRDICSENSVEIDYYERMAREKSGVSSSSSNSSTIRTQSNASLGSLGNISQGSAGSFNSVVSDNMVRSRLSASARSQYSESCDEEIVWKKGNLLGRGAFGTVWCGLTDTGGMIAVKQVELNHSNWEEAEEQYEKLQEEVSLLKSLKHKNIVKFIGTCLDGGVVNIFMEYVPGGSIASLLARFGCLDESVFRRYTKQLLSGVSYIHGNNVIHRDIKGGNILIMPSGVLKLIDFGCAKRLYMNLSMSRSNILRSMKGTPYWMAPEVIRETGHGRKSDIWSVGCTVFEMATAKPPWSDMPPMAAIFAIGSGSLAVPQLAEDFSEGARDFVKKCLTRDPDLRPSADELLQHHFLRDPL